MSAPSRLNSPLPVRAVRVPSAPATVALAPDPGPDLYSINPPLDSDRHRQYIEDLLSALRTWFAIWLALHPEARGIYATGNLTIFFDPNRNPRQNFLGPDLFVVLDTENIPRKSWMVWKEGKFPNLIVELLSESTAVKDRTSKKETYQDVFRTPEYFWFDPNPNSLEFAGFRLNSAGVYEPIQPNESGWRWSEQLGLFLGLVEGKLRWITLEGTVLLTDRERAEEAYLARQQAEQQCQQEQVARLQAEEQRQQEQAARQQAEQQRQQEQAARQQAERDRQQAEQQRQQEQLARQAAEQERDALRDRLRRLGIDPEGMDSDALA